MNFSMLRGKNGSSYATEGFPCFEIAPMNNVCILMVCKFTDNLGIQLSEINIRLKILVRAKDGLVH